MLGIIIPYQVSEFFFEKTKMPTFLSFVNTLCLMPLAAFASQEPPYAINEQPLMSRTRMQEV